jgi:hypothetical protein
MISLDSRVGGRRAVASGMTAVCILLTACFVAHGSTDMSSLSQQTEDGPTNSSVQVDLSPYGPEKPEVEFSYGGNLILCWWLPQPPIGDYYKLLGRCVVFDLKGRVVSDATDSHGRLTKNYEMMFPTTAARQHFAWFLKDTNSVRTTLWGFSRDYSLGFRFLKPEGHFSLGDGELWSLGDGTKRIWTVQLPEKVGYQGIAAFLSDRGQSNILVAFSVSQAYVLSAKDGHVVDDFTYGKPETDAEQRAYRRKFGLMAEIGDPSLSFSAGPLAFDSSRHLLACGALDGRRVRVVNADPAHNIVFEAHTNDNPERPRGGLWSVVSVRFEACGKYLTAEYQFGGRLTLKHLTAAEVFDTRTWLVVWSDQKSGRATARAPRISPDGKTMALIKDDQLQIGRFAH